MKFDTYGNKSQQVILMLTGSFCPGECLQYLYQKLESEYYIIVPTYNGHYEGSCDFTSRKGEAVEIKEFLLKNQIYTIDLIYGQSMGCEVGMELMRQFQSCGIKVNKAFFDGGPFANLSFFYKKFLCYKFKMLIKIAREKTVDEVMNMRFLKQFAGDKMEVLRPSLEALAKTARYLTSKSIKNIAECCYTFDFPEFSKEMQKNIYLFYGSEEKAYKASFKGVKRAYPFANYRIENKQAHLTYAGEHTEDYIAWMKKLCDDVDIPFEAFQEKGETE